MEILLYILIALIALGSLFAQSISAASVFESFDPKGTDFPPGALIYLVPAGLGLLITIGLTIMALLAWLDPNQVLPEPVIAYTFSALLFTLIIIVKNVVGPITNGYLACYAIYHWATYGEPRLWPLMQWVIGLVVDVGSMSSAALIYTVIFIIISLVTNGIGAIADL